jgi:hypothetical protein
MLALACIKSAAVTLFAALAELGLLIVEAFVGAILALFILIVIFSGSLEVVLLGESTAVDASED